MAEIDRRTFIKTSLLASGALVIGVGCERAGNGGLSADNEWRPNLYIKVNTDNTVTIVSKNPECGQGVKTAFPMIVAECMGADWENVSVEQAPLDDRYGRQAAAGSYGTPDGWNDLRLAGAAAKYLLISAAAEAWGVRRNGCTVDRSVVTHKDSDRSRSFGSLVAIAAELPAPLVSQLDLKSRPAEFDLLGKFVPGVDNHKILTGEPLFGSDVRLPDMHYAVFQKCPAYWGNVRKANIEEILRLPGVSAAFVVQPSEGESGPRPGVAIVAESWWQAQSARKQLRVDWDTVQSESTSDYARQAADLKSGEGQLVRSYGNLPRAFDAAHKVVKASYYYPFVAHATMEPQNCTALVHESGRLEIWAPSQNPASGRRMVAEALQISESDIDVHITRMGGGFGRRLVNDFMVEAAWIAKVAARPVQLQWSREDDLQHDSYRPAAWHHFVAALDGLGRISAFDHHFITFGRNGKPGSGASLSGRHYPAGLVPNFRLRQSVIESNVPTGPWRSPGHSAYCWAYQSFFDELAFAAQLDPLEFRLNLLSGTYGRRPMNLSRARSTLNAAAELAGWGSRQLESGKGQGIAFHHDHSGYVSQVAQVAMAGSKLKVEKVFAGVDVGPILNLSGAKHQVEGAVIDALSTANLEVPFAAGAADVNNFHDYRLLRFDQAPEIECEFLQSDNSPTGLGEPPIAPVTPAITNAIFAASGIRVRELPLSRSGIEL